MSKYLPAEDVLAYVKNEVSNCESQAYWARAAGISPQYLSDFLAERRGPGPAILKAIGYEPTPYYRKADD